MRRPLIPLALATLTLLLAACGGGDALPDEIEEHAKRVTPPACTTQPERCR
jgi:hypothetical protein